MKLTGYFFAALLSSTLMAGCTTANPDNSMEQAQERMTITGSIAYREKIALPPDSVAQISLSDISLADAPSKLISEQTIALERQQVPISFNLDVPDDKIMPRRRYAVRGTISAPDGSLLWTTDTVHLINNETMKQDLGTLNLVRVEPSDTSNETISAVFRCADNKINASFSGDIVRLDTDGRAYTLNRVISGSGAKYESGSGDNYILFWNKGSDAILQYGDNKPVNCSEIPDDARALLQTGKTWIVEDIDGGGIIDRSRVSMTFSQDGRLSGMASCNNYNGRYSVDGETLKQSGPFALTRKMCPPALMMQERRFMETLVSGLRITAGDNGALLLKNDKGGSILAR